MGPFNRKKRLKPLRERLADYHRKNPLKGAIDLKKWMQDKKDRIEQYRNQRQQEKQT